MLTLNQVSALLANSLGVEPARVNKIVRHLQDANLLPRGRRGIGGAAGCDVKDAVHLILGIMGGADSPARAVEFVRAVASMPASHLRSITPRPDGAPLLQFAAIEDVPIMAAHGGTMVAMTRSFRSYLESVVSAQMQDTPPDYPDLPATVSVLDSLTSPMAMADVAAMPGGQNALIFSRSLANPEAVSTRRFWAWRYMSGAVLAQLGDLFAGRTAQSNSGLHSRTDGGRIGEIAA